MRKLISLLGIVITLLIPISNDFSSVEVKSINDLEVQYLSNIYNPIIPYTSLEVAGSISILSGSNKDRLRIKYELFSPFRYNAGKSYASGYASKEFSYNSPINVDYSFVIDDRVSNFARSGIKVKLGIYDLVSKTYLDFVESTLYSIKGETLNIEELNGDISFSKSLYLNKEVISEIYNFSNYSSIIEIEHYHYLDLSSLSFIYHSYKPFSCKNAYITFIDIYDLFPYIKEVDGKKQVSLVPVVKEDIITFKFKDLYVDKDSLMLSSTSKQGYMKTNYFYFPKNKLSKLQGFSFDINVNEMGASALSFSFSCTVNIDSLLIGPCNLSEYCVVGGVEE